MALPPGTRLGPYEVTAQIGVGGMGEVYGATDTNLKRAVAIKVLPASVAGDTERLARFQREAEVLASLNHPHIAAIYGLERSGGITALVMELVEGPTLADRIAQGAIPIDEALPIAKQIAEALEAAHEQGIIHRDLKPANIKVRLDGTVKVLDFGLAKAMEPAPGSSPSMSQSPTITSPAMTEAGMILGTAVYMSPEQARGKPVDKRADIWAFGCVLYEMLTGRRSFDTGDTISDAVAAILTREPDWNFVPARTPPTVLRLLRRCMQKDPGRRLHHIADARLDIEDAIRESFELPASHPGDRRPSALLARALPWAIAAIALGVIAWMLASTRAAPGGIGLVRLELNPPSGVELYTASARTVGVSPDGSRIAFVGVLSGGRQVYVRSLDQLEAVPVRGSENATGFVFSPEGESIGVVDAGGVLKTIRLSDGTMTTVTREVSILYGAAWGRDERIVFVRDGALWRVPSSGGTPEALTALATDTLHAWPFVIGNGEAILFGAASGDDWRIDAVVPATGERRTIVERGRLPLHAASGHLLFFRDGELLAAPFDTDRLEVTGLAVRTINSLPAIASGIPPLDVSASGTLVYSPMTSNSTVVWVSRSGAEQSLNTTLRPYTNPRLRGDGTALLVQAGDLWIQDLARSTFTRLAASDAVLNGFPIWTADGTRVVYKITTALRVQDSDGSDSRVIEGTTGFDFPASVTPDGETLIFMRSSEATSFDIYTVPLRGGERPKPILTTRAYEGGGRLSPDGRWLIYVSNESGQNEVYLRQFPGPERRWQVSTEGGTQAAWNANGREIFYRDGDRMMAVEVSTTQSVVLSPPQVLFVQRYAYGAGITIANYDVTPDGARFVMIKDESTAGRLNIVLNWFEDLKRLVPTN